MYYFAFDQVGIVYLVANNKGNEVKRIIYDSFGNLMVDTNEQVNLVLGFAAGLYDRDTGLVHFGYREYDSLVGRFIQPDPLGFAGGDVDIYGYCSDDPVNFVDRLGLKKNEGPTPSGEYEFDPKEASEIEGVNFWARRLRGDWGHGRVPLRPSNGTETHGRDGFYIHGGDTEGSKGCIDIGDKDKDFFRNVRKTKNKVKVRVH